MNKWAKTLGMFLVSILVLGQVNAANYGLPEPNELVPISETKSYPVLKGLKVDANDPFILEFIIDTNGSQSISDAQVRELVEYFLACVTIPEKDLWVNLSPNEDDRIIPQELAQTSLGKDLLGQDYILKQLVSTVTHPQNAIGKLYWKALNQKIIQAYGTLNTPVSTYNKVWITPDYANVLESGNVAVIKDAKLKVLTEEDFIAMKNVGEGLASSQNGLVNKAASKVTKDIVLPNITRDVNQGENFARLRQIYHSFILASWFKNKVKDTLYKHYIDQKKIIGIDLADKDVKEKIFELYVKAYKKGLYNYSEVERDAASGKRIRRRYFSGGHRLTNKNTAIKVTDLEALKDLIDGVPNAKVKKVEVDEVKGKPDGDTPKGAPATLLQEMLVRNIFKGNTKTTKDISEKRMGNNSLSTIQNELKVLRKAGIVGGNRKGYYLKEFVREMDLEKFITDHPNLEKGTYKEKVAEETAEQVSNSLSPENEWKYYEQKVPVNFMIQNIDLINGEMATGAVTGGSNIDNGIAAGANAFLGGHSERRKFFGETDEDVNRKLKLALENPLIQEYTVCIGEDYDIRYPNATKDDSGPEDSEAVARYLKKQIETIFKGISPEDAAKVVIAYEPLWAIGGSGKGVTATVDQVEHAHNVIGNQIFNLYDAGVALAVKITYGGSVKLKNAADLIAIPGVDGFLIGGASTDAITYAAIGKALEVQGKIDGEQYILGSNFKVMPIKSTSKEYMQALAELDFDYVRIDMAPSNTQMSTYNRVSRGLPANIKPLPPRIAVNLMIQNVDIRDKKDGSGKEFVSGAVTGATNVERGVAAGANAFLGGHSERRKFFGETDELVNEKLKLALADPSIQEYTVCVGEDFKVRYPNATDKDLGKENAKAAAHYVINQINTIFRDISTEDAAKVTIAYEPLWAIGGSGELAVSANAQQVEYMHNAIRTFMSTMYNAKIDDYVKITYGGSVKLKNAAQLIAIPGVDGFLIGGASTDAPTYAGIGKIIEEQGKKDGKQYILGSNFKLMPIKSSFMEYVDYLSVLDPQYVRIDMAPSDTQMADFTRAIHSPAKEDSTVGGVALTDSGINVESKDGLDFELSAQAIKGFENNKGLKILSITEGSDLEKMLK